MVKLIDKFMHALGFKKLIKIPGKSSYNQLSRSEVAMMIDAFLGEGNDFFDPLAFNDFLHADLQNDDLKQLQKDLNSKAFGPSKDNEWPPVNRDYLVRLISQLKSED